MKFKLKMGIEKIGPYEFINDGENPSTFAVVRGTRHLGLIHGLRLSGGIVRLHFFTREGVVSKGYDTPLEVATAFERYLDTDLFKPFNTTSRLVKMENFTTGEYRIYER
jgi:hypothetical protein